MAKNKGWGLSKKVIILGLVLVVSISGVALVLGKNSTNVAEKIQLISKPDVKVQNISKKETSNYAFISSVPLNLKGNSASEAKEIQLSPKTNVKVKEIIQTEIGDCVFTVTSVSESMGNGHKTASEGKKLICINFRVENKGNEEQQMTSVMMFKLADSKQQQYNIVTPEGVDSINGILSANAIISGKVWFEVPKVEKKFQLTIRPSMLEQNTDMLNIDTTGVTTTVDGRKDDGQKQDKEYTILKSKSGREVKIGNLVFKLISISTEGVGTFGTEDEDYKLINLEVSVKNNGKKEEQITSNMIFKLTDSERAVYSIVFPEKQGVNGLLKSKEKLQGKILFKVKRDKNNYKLEIKPWEMKSVKASIDIKI